MRVAIVQNSKVVAEKPLSKVRHPRISNMAALPVNELIRYGVYPLEESVTSYDSKYQTRGYQYDIKASKVVKAYTAVDKPIEQVKQDYFAAIKTKINKLLLKGFSTSFGIKMDSTTESVQKLDAGYQLATRSGATTMQIRDYDNISHNDIPVSQVASMVEELALYILQRTQEKWALQDTVATATTPYDAMVAGEAALVTLQGQIDAVSTAG